MNRVEYSLIPEYIPGVNDYLFYNNSPDLIKLCTDFDIFETHKSNRNKVITKIKKELVSTTTHMSGGRYL